MLREILGRRRRERKALLSSALQAAGWHWPVVPGAGIASDSSCRCGRDDCPVPGAHPADPPLLAATWDERMVTWWWSRLPDAPIMLATGGPVAALSVPEAAGIRALGQLDKLGVRTGPVTASPGRYAFLVAPYRLDELAELLETYGLGRYGNVPPTLRFHGVGGFVPLPASRLPGGAVTWARLPGRTTGMSPPWLPQVADLVRTLVDTCHHVDVH